MSARSRPADGFGDAVWAEEGETGGAGALARGVDDEDGDAGAVWTVEAGEVEGEGLWLIFGVDEDVGGPWAGF